MPRVSLDIKFLIFWLVLAIIFVCIYSYNAAQPLAYITPDETINNAYTQLYKDTGQLYYEEDLNSVADDIIHPRGTLIIDGKIVPSKFIGLPLYYGTFSSIIGDGASTYLTPIFAVIGALFIFLLGKELFGKRNGIISLFLLLLLPPYWYWSSYPMMENVFAAVCFALGLVYFLKGSSTSSVKHYVLAFLFLAISWSIRPDTVLFLIPLSVIFGLNLILTWKRTGSKQVIKIAAGSVLVFTLAVLPILLINNQLYGNPLLSGSTVTSGEAIPPVGNTPSHLFTNIGVLLSAAPLFAFSILGAFMCFRKQTATTGQNPNLIRIYVAFVLLSAIMFFYLYLTGVLPKKTVPLMESYVRYFLPLYLASLPLLALFIQRLWNWRRILAISFITLYLIVSVTTVYSSLNGVSGESAVWRVRDSYAVTSNYIIDNTEPDSVVLVWGLDKIIYPERRVGSISLLPEENREEQLAVIALNISDRDVPLYYLHTYTPTDLSLFESELMKVGLKLERIENSDLYRFIK